MDDDDLENTVLTLAFYVAPIVTRAHLGTSVLFRSGAPQRINLNLILDYPVSWSRFKVLRDFIQNFYDAVGHQAWVSRFHSQLRGDVLHLVASEVGFSYDWLIHIGASTICLHSHRTHDRERNTLYKMDVVKLVRRVVGLTPPETALRLLEMLSTLWYRYPRKQYDFDSWYSIVNTLVSQVARSAEQTRLFREKHPDLLVASQVRRRDIVSCNKRRQALAWRRQSHARFRLVQDSFRELGYPTLEEVCERNNGFPLLREPGGREVALVDLLMDAANELFPRFFGPGSLPPCRIIQSGTSAWMGMAVCVTLEDPVDNTYGLHIRYRLPYVALKGYLFGPGMWSESFSTYLHELAHVFGGDHSANFSHAFTIMLDIVLRCARVLTGHEDRWDALFIDEIGGNEDTPTPGTGDRGHVSQLTNKRAALSESPLY